MTNTWYAWDWDQAYRPSYAEIRRTVVRHIQVHLYLNIKNLWSFDILSPAETEHALECHEDRLHRKQEQIKALLANLVRQQEEEVAMQKLVDNTLASITDDQQQLHLLEEKLQQCTNAIETIEKI